MSAFADKHRVTRLPGGPVSHTKRWVADVSELCKARITLMVLVTTLVGFLFGWRGPVDLLYLFHTLAGTALAASGAAALNQVFEVELDAQMRRTRNRPLPGRRMTLDEGLIIGIICSASGILWLSIATNICAGILSARNDCIYVFVYTPLKRVTTLEHDRRRDPGCSSAGDRLDGCPRCTKFRKLDSLRDSFLVANATFSFDLLAVPRRL